MNPMLIINPENVDINNISEYTIRHAARGVVFDENKNVALLLVGKHGYYKLPGGGIDEGEDKVSAFRRECLEEIGTDVEVIEELGSIVEYRKEKMLLHTSYCYIAKATGDKQQPAFTEHELENGFQEAIWVSLDKAIELVKTPTDNYVGKFIIERDLFILEKVKGLGIL